MMIQSNHSQYVANPGISLISLEVACETSAKASGIPGSTVQFLNPNQKDDVHNLALLFADVFMEREPAVPCPHTGR
ncbi:uncharacterized protein LDX57_010272 [Aspergillus melleus]|uniref:uncharacterized protein n=1 Tax=Aspergillus melleus TaxID=138277 RepID=UPI001E8E4EBF|nr:uncharacterized protein LDX57_010272 [Aspergillus melleus]KAH8432645.1 hypothetical protein LDX57_010272 [Aspergillus melleus]